VIPVHPITKQKIPVQDTDVQWMRYPTVLSACDDVKYPFDADTVKRIRQEFGPESFIPLVRYTTYRSPSGAFYTWPHHLWARYIANPEVLQSNRLAKRVLWPVNPGATNYGFEKYGHRLYIEHIFDGGLGGDSTRSPGRIWPINPSHYKFVKDCFDLARHVSQEEQAREQAEAEANAQMKADDEVSEMQWYRMREDYHRHVGNTRLAVPSNYGEAA
jgi:hypothetical protein